MLFPPTFFYMLFPPSFAPFSVTFFLAPPWRSFLFVFSLLRRAPSPRTVFFPFCPMGQWLCRICTISMNLFHFWLHVPTILFSFLPIFSPTSFVKEWELPGLPPSPPRSMWSFFFFFFLPPFCFHPSSNYSPCRFPLLVLYLLRHPFLG